MPTPSTPLDPAIAKVARTLNICIEACTDGEKGYAIAAADVRDPALKSLFFDYAKQRAEFVSQLQVAVARLGAFPENRGSASGAMHRGFMGVRRALEGHSDKIVLDDCVRGERAALSAYDHAVEKTPLGTLAPEIAAMLVSQRAAIESARANVANQLNQRFPS